MYVCNLLTALVTQWVRGGLGGGCEGVQSTELLCTGYGASFIPVPRVALQSRDAFHASSE